MVGSELPAYSIRRFLFADVGANLFQFEPDGRYRITAGPEVLACEVSFLTTQAGDGDSTLPFEKPDHRSYRMLGWNGDANVHMVGHQMAFDNLALLLPSQGVEDRTQLPTRLAEDGFPSPFGYENNVVLAVPFRMG
jgi:hypothetical protein